MREFIYNHPIAVSLAFGSVVITSWLSDGWLMPLILGVIGFFVGSALERDQE